MASRWRRFRACLRKTDIDNGPEQEGWTNNCKSSFFTAQIRRAAVALSHLRLVGHFPSFLLKAVLSPIQLRRAFYSPHQSSAHHPAFGDGTVTQQRLTFRGKQVADTITLAEGRVETGSVLHLVSALRRG